MKVDVYDTYARNPAEKLIHFDVLVPSGTSGDTALKFAIEWLNNIGEPDTELKQEECRFCHQENATAEVLADIQDKGHYILQMDGCPNPI